MMELVNVDVSWAVSFIIIIIFFLIVTLFHFK